MICRRKWFLLDLPCKMDGSYILFYMDVCWSRLTLKCFLCFTLCVWTWISMPVLMTLIAFRQLAGAIKSNLSLWSKKKLLNTVFRSLLLFVILKSTKSLDILNMTHKQLVQSNMEKVFPNSFIWGFYIISSASCGWLRLAKNWIFTPYQHNRVTGIESLMPDTVRSKKLNDLSMKDHLFICWDLVLSWGLEFDFYYV